MTVEGAGDRIGRRAEVGTVEPEDVWGAEPVIRRIVSARVSDPAAIEDLVQDALERLLRARKRIDPSWLIPYAVVTARNLVAGRARKAGREELRADVDTFSFAGPADDRLVADEDREALITALARLPLREREWLVAHDAGGVPVGDLDSGGASPATMRVRLARARAKLRVEYVLATAGHELPSEHCRPTLMTLAGGQRTRQAAAARHLLECPTCAALSDEVVTRRPGLAIVVPVLGWRAIARGIRSHPAVSAAGAATAAAAATAGIVASAASSSAAGPQAVRGPTAAVTAPRSLTTPAAASSALSVDGHPLVVPVGSLDGWAGHTVTARRVLVQSVVTHDGFWVGPSPAQRVFVELVGPLRSLQVRTGEHVSFTAPLMIQTATYAAEVGVTTAEGAAQLTTQGAHLAVPTTGLTVQP